MFNDIADKILNSENVIHDPTSNNGDNVLADHLKTICGNLYGVDNINVKPINLIYMIYGALFTLPYTTKLEDNDVEAVLVRKTQTDLKILISYNTDEKLKIKVLVFNVEQRTVHKPMNFRLINTMYEKLKSVKKGRLLTKPEFRQAFTKIHNFDIHQTPDGRVDIQASDILVKISERFDTYTKFTRSFNTIIPNALTKGTFDSNLINMKSQSSKIAKENAHQMIKTIIQTYQRRAHRNRLSKKLNKMYNFIIGAFELNFGQHHNLVIQPIYDNLAFSFVDIIIKVQGQNKPWLSTTYPIIFKFVSASEEEWKTYALNQDSTLTELIDKTSRPLHKLDTDANKVICLNAHYDGVLENIELISQKGYTNSYPTKSILHSKVLPIAIPHKQFIQAISRLLVSSDRLGDVEQYNDYAIEALESFNDKYKDDLLKPNSFESYIFGILSSSNDIKVNDIEVYRFQHKEKLLSRCMITLCLISKSKSSAIVLNTLQVKKTEDFLFFKTFLHNYYPNFATKIKRIIRITMNTNPNYPSVFTDQVLAPLGNKNNHLLGKLKVITSRNSLDLLTSLSKSYDSQYLPMKNSHDVSKMVENLKIFLGNRHVSIGNIQIFLRGFFSGGYLIDFKNMPGVFGIVKADQTPLFISIIHSERKGNYELMARKKLIEILKQYLPDYLTNPMRGTADFVSIVTSPSSGNDGKIRGMLRVSTTGRLFKQCLPMTSQIRQKRNAKLVCKNLFEDVYDEENENPEIKQSEKYRYSPTEELGEKLPETKIVPMERRPFISKVAKISHSLMGVTVFKDMIGALIRKDYKDFAINTAFLLGGPLIESLSVRMSSLGSSLTSRSSAFFGKTLLVTTPFLARLPMQGFVAYDLIQQVDKYRAGDKDAKVNIIGDSTILATEFVTAGIDGAAALGYLTTAAEFTGPIGMAIGTAIFIGVDIYTAVRTVAKIENLVHLTGLERFTSGLLSFLHVGPTSKVQNLIFEKEIADTSAKNALSFFEKHSFVKNYIFPKYKIDDGMLKFVDNNYANLNIRKEKWNRIWPVDTPGLKLTCSPYNFNTTNVDQSLKTSKMLHECQNMFGYENLNNKNSNITIILLEDGNDTLEAAPDKNTVIIGDGYKNIRGNLKTDTFILQGNSSHGFLDGMGGDDILNLNNYAKNRRLIIDLRDDGGYISFENGENHIILRKIHNLIGRENAHEHIKCDCSTKFLDTRGGHHLLSDEIEIWDNANCINHMQIPIQGYTNLRHYVRNGTFSYILKTENLSSSFRFTENDQSTHILIIPQGSLHDVDTVTLLRNKNDSYDYDATIRFNDKGKLVLKNPNKNITLLFGNDTEMKFVKDTVQIRTSSTDDSIENIVKEYSALAHKLNAVVHVQSDLENASLLFGCGKAAYHGPHSVENVDHINMLPSDPYKNSYLVGCSNNQNVYRISVPDLHKTVQSDDTCNVEPMKPVTVLNTNTEIKQVPDILDLYELVILIKIMCNSRLFSKFFLHNMETDISIELFYYIGIDKMSLMNITMMNVHNIDHSILLNMRRPMQISLTSGGEIELKPLPIYKNNDSLISINVFDIEPYTNIISSKTIGSKYDKFRMKNTSLLITNAQYVDKDQEFIAVYLEDFFIEEDMQTLNLLFEDEHIEFNDENYDAEDFELIEDFEAIENDI